MPAHPRREIVANDQVGVYHCTARCVRRAFLCGMDFASGRNLDHRKAWIRDRLQQLASIFAIEVCGYAVMSNHLHVVARVRPDLVDSWPDDEVALRWRRLFPPRDEVTGRPTELQDHDLAMITSNPSRIGELRERLSSLSWFMRSLNEPIARRANREDECTGRFWEGRFKSQALLDDAAILACSVYVDLNPIRAGIAETPEGSEYTSAFDRIRSLGCTRSAAGAEEEGRVEELASGVSSEVLVSPEPERPDAWLCELTLREGHDGEKEIVASATVTDVSRLVDPSREEPSAPHGRRPSLAARASDRGFLPMSLESYLSLLDWTGRELRSGKRGTIPRGLSPILDRLGVNGEGWLETVRHFGRWFKRAAGRRDSLAAAATQAGRRWFQGQGSAKLSFR